MYHHIVYDKELIPTDRIPANCDTLNGISFEILVSNGSHVSIGDELIHFRFYQRFSNDVIGEYVLPSLHDGYICGIWGESGKRYRGVFMLSRVILMTICPSADDTIQYKYPTFYKVIQDEVTGNHLICWERIAGLRSTEYVLSSSFALRFNVDEHAPTTALHFSKTACNIRKMDVIVFVFEDEEVVRVPLTSKPLLNDRQPGGFLVDIPLSGKDIQLFATKGWKSFRIEHGNGERPLIVPNKRQDRESMDVFKRFVQEYIKALTELGIDLSEPIKEEPQFMQMSDEPCYVYLMVDTTNGYHKIGISNHPEYRERTLQSEKPTIEKVCAKQYPSRQIALAIESALHTTFSMKRIRGEWFDLTAEDIAQVIDTLK